MSFDFFVLPFFLGLLTLLVMLGLRYGQWIKGLDAGDKALIRHGIWSVRSLAALKEVFMESLLHHKMFKRNILLGYMHMSFAFGWFMLILTGNIESRIYSKVHVNPPYYPIFLKFFVHDRRVMTFELTSVPGVFRFLMDLFLALIMSGLVLAFIKRASSNWFGLKRTTHHTLFDRMAITTLWLVFPLRLLAESFTAGQYLGGGFLTNHLGMFFARFLPVEHLSYPAWWAYSIALGIFFVTLPYSRFMHIPTEVLLIFLRHWGVKAKKEFNNISEIEVYSCPRCGVCLDACPVFAVKQNGTPPVYYLRSIRENKISEKVTYDCLLCGRCEAFCPVGIDNNLLRQSQRIRLMSHVDGSYGYLPATNGQASEVAYFAGCMTHLTPQVWRAVVTLFDQAGVRYRFVDRDGTVCCGRPLMMAGNVARARQLIDHNKEMIKNTACTTLVTSCPICYKVFREEYNLGIEVLHHSQYLLRLQQEGRLTPPHSGMTVVYHDPCELGRGSGVYDEPRLLLRQVAALVEGKDNREEALCCGGSLGNTEISNARRDEITARTLHSLQINHPEAIITACPLCKKTFAKKAEVPVMDIAEMLAGKKILRDTTFDVRCSKF
jgi:Fe-S oxidoreductase